MKILRLLNIIRNMGMRYTQFRLFYEFRRKTGLLKSKFPTQPKFIDCTITLDEWKKNAPKFFFESKESLKITKNQHSELHETFNDIKNYAYTYFSKTKLSLGKDFDWITNPETGYKYELIHWSQIVDLSKQAGDIKYVWEKARFSFLYDIIRYDYHFDKDCSKLVFNEIESFLGHNPINLGPNYRCSQEISLRILNWSFALYYYRNSAALTEERFKSIMNAIYWQLHHVYNNINFSRIAVRNNHALTETLMLFLGGLLFPFLPDTKKWSVKGKKWFQEEIAYQIYKDGTFLQFSMNYHRVVIQLLTWGIKLGEIHDSPFNSTVYERAKKSLYFLRQCQDEQSGKLPNYGANDGALFFKLTNDDYRVYTSQLNDLSAVLFNEVSKQDESQRWYGITNAKIITQEYNNLAAFPLGGNFVINDGSTKTFIKCAQYKDRPGHADNLHVDIWLDGENYIWDTGSYKYNTTEEYSEFFSRCHGHNTVSLDGRDQMLKGSRFIWNYWTKKAKANLSETPNTHEFSGQFQGFPELGNKIVHKRSLSKKKGRNKWTISDSLQNAENLTAQLYWHFNPETYNQIDIVCKDCDGKLLNPVIEEKWCSNYYGEIEPSIRHTYMSETGFETTIEIKSK
ncbi:heparinase II/III family protein [uncultured Croceitalea sp.]|uniref:heparinase II/III domain-containing protein n=1 Tax=uncultured Croceitalea sp. TaxID=1798908 RepID=UPI003306105A